MKDAFELVKPAILPPLDEDFRPAVLANRAFRDEVVASGAGVPLLIGLERCDGYISHYQTEVFPADHFRADANLHYVERIIKFLIWQFNGICCVYYNPAEKNCENHTYCAYEYVFAYVFK